MYSPRIKGTIRRRFLSVISSVILFTSLIQECHSRKIQSECLKKFREGSKAGERFIFECSDDGYYKPMQCEPRTGFCFCVDVITGAALVDTSFRMEKREESIDCTKIQKEKIRHMTGAGPFIGTFNITLNESTTTTKSKSPEEDTQTSPTEVKPQRKPSQNAGSNSIPAEPKTNRNRNAARSCNNDRETIRHSLVRELRDGNYGRQNRTITGMRRQSVDRSVSDRKFYELDTNRDHRLGENEFNQFIRDTLKKSSMYSLQRCANSFNRYCDTNNDRFVSATELHACLNRQHVPRNNNNANNSKPQRQRNRHGGEDYNGSLDRSTGEIETTTKRPRLPRNETKKPPHHGGRLNGRYPESLHKTNIQHKERSTGASAFPSLPIDDNAQYYRKNAMNDNNGFDCNIVRENSGKLQPMALKCTVGGAYAPLHCELDSCWCVSEITGLSIKRVPKNSTESTCFRQFKGCDRQQRRIFHQEIRNQLERRQVNCSRAFESMDIDRDGYVTQREWRPFKKSMREQISHEKRRCLKSELAFCDKDQDKLLSADEWTFCCDSAYDMSSSFETSRGHSATDTRSPDEKRRSLELQRIYNEKKDLQRSGPPPFHSILSVD